MANKILLSFVLVLTIYGLMQVTLAKRHRNRHRRPRNQTDIATDNGRDINVTLADGRQKSISCPPTTPISITSALYTPSKLQIQNRCPKAADADSAYDDCNNKPTCALRAQDPSTDESCGHRSLVVLYRCSADSLSAANDDHGDDRPDEVTEDDF